jgi:small redox-active disulfide protein 2
MMMDIRILGTGCAKCKTLEANVKDAVKELGIQAEVSKVTDIADIMEYDIMMTPGLVVNGKVLLSGKVPGVEQIRQLIEKEL